MHNLDDIKMNFDNVELKYNGIIAIYDNVIDKDICTRILQTVESSGEKFQTSKINTTDKSVLLMTLEEIAITDNTKLTKLDELLYNIFNTSIMQYIIDINHNSTNDEYSIINITSDDGYKLLCYPPDAFHKPHVDQNTDENDKKKLCLVSGILYLNEDFEGGQTNFPLQNVSITPKIGRVILFPSSFSHIYESKPIISGYKYAIVTWFR